MVYNETMVVPILSTFGLLERHNNQCMYTQWSPNVAQMTFGLKFRSPALSWL